MKTLVTLTGGMDSTYLLWKLLTETSDEITAVNFDLGNTDKNIFLNYEIRTFAREDFTPDQKGKVVAISTWLNENVRNFTFIKEPLAEEFLAKDPMLPNNTAGYFARYAIPKINNFEFDRICLSHEWENDGSGNGGTIGDTRRPGSWIARELFIANATRGSVEFTLLDMGYNQAYALSEMPKELIDLIRYPKTSDKSKSDKTSWFKKQLNEGKTPAEIGAIAKAKCMLPNGKWYSMRSWVSGKEPDELNTWDMPTWPSSYEVPSSV